MDFVMPSVIPSDDDSKLTEAYRKLRESEVTKDDKISEKDQIIIDKECEVIKNREIIAHDPIHEPVEIINKKGPVSTGPPTLTRFEKARIMGARALQLSYGAPSFIEIPKNATTSLEIAMEELNKRVIPIIIKRTLPNGDFQNISLDQFE
jgi:DNA-directed RNA polymerase I, II, and III subunit RPABC2